MFFSKHAQLYVYSGHITLTQMNVSCKITQQILLPIFSNYISPSGGIISFNIVGQEAFK